MSSFFHVTPNKEAKADLQMIIHEPVLENLTSHVEI